MKYHALPMPDINNQETYNLLPKKIRQVAKILHRETAVSIKKMNKNNANTCSLDIYYLFSNDSMQNLMGKLCDGDEIIVHGEGQPFILGLEEPSNYDLHGQSFAKLLYNHRMPDIDINITLLACHSATNYAPNKGVDINFARDMSKALSFYQYQKVTVTGYTGLIVVKNGGKYSVSSKIIEKALNGTHSSLDDARIIYRNGSAIITTRIMADLSNIAYSWADQYIANAIAGQKCIAIRTAAAEKTNMKVDFTPSILSFFNTNKALEQVTLLESSSGDSQQTACECKNP